MRRIGKYTVGSNINTYPHLFIIHDTDKDVQFLQEHEMLCKCSDESTAWWIASCLAYCDRVDRDNENAR